MMITPRKSEKGQAIVMIALAIIGLFGLIALAMDGGHAFSDRRQAQNAADAAALAASLAYTNSPTLLTDTQLGVIAVQSTTLNGYDNDHIRSVVNLTSTASVTGTDPDQCNPKTTGRDIVVTIDSYLPTWFAQIVGVTQVHNLVSGTSRACKPYTDEAFFGNAVVALSPDGCALTVGGNGTTEVTGSGLYSNGGFCDNGHAGGLTAPSGINAKGGCTYNGSGTPTYSCNTSAQTPPKFDWPKPPTCPDDAQKTITSGHGPNAIGTRRDPSQKSPATPTGEWLEGGQGSLEGRWSRRTRTSQRQDRIPRSVCRA